MAIDPKTGFDMQLESEQAYSPTLRLLGAGVAGGSAYMMHRHMLATMPGYAEKLHSWALKFEERSPWQMGRTFGLSERFGAYLPQHLQFGPAELFKTDGSLNFIGETFQRQFKNRLDVAREVSYDTPLIFEGRRAGVPHMKLASHGGRGIETMFTPANGRLAGSASRLDAELYEEAFMRSSDPAWYNRAWSDFSSFRKSQFINNKLPKDLSHVDYRPFHTKHAAEVTDDLLEPIQRMRSWWNNSYSRVRVEALEAFERPQRLFAEAGFGLKRGTWNSASSLISGMLLKRVLPVVAGVTALKYLDYKTGHHVSNAMIDAPLKANVLRADLTDMLPGGRSVTDFYDDVVPGPQYAPLALPLAGAFAGALYHYSKVARGKFLTEAGREASARLLPDLKVMKRWAGQTKRSFASVEGAAAVWKHLGAPGKGAVIGLAAMLPFVPGMIGSRKSGAELRDIYSGEQPVPVRAGRWWELGSSAFEGGRIKAWRPHKSVLMKSRAEVKSLWGSEKEAWKHNPILHPLRWLRDPYALEKLHYEDRPYPVASPAFSNVPLIGPLLAATLGKIVKPPTRMHEDVWSGDDYSLYSTRLEPKGPGAIAPPKPQEEFGIIDALKKEAGIFAEYTGLYGFIAQSGYNALLPDYDKGREAFFQGSRQMSNFSRRYYEQELGAGIGLAPSLKEHFGYTEPFRRFVQREDFTPQANEIPNKMPSWLPGDDYFTNFRVGDPYVKIDEGYARLPGAGYAALHPELEGVNPEDYPDIHKLSILADVAPYSREFNTFKQIVGKQAAGDTELRIEYDRILDRVQQMKDSVIRMDERRFTAPTEEIEGTVAGATLGGFTLEEFPGRTFKFSSVGISAADMTAAILGENNNMTRAEAAREVERRRGEVSQYLGSLVGKRARITAPLGAAENSERISAVLAVGGDNINRELIDRGYGQYREDLGGAEASAMHGAFGRALGTVAEALSFQGDSSHLNPMRYVPSPAHTKLWQERTAIAQYISQEVAGTRMRRWHRPIHDFVGPYIRGMAERLTGHAVVPGDVQFRRDLNTLSDSLEYLRGQVSPTYTSQSRRTAVGANMFASPMFVASTLPDREAHYFRAFLQESDPEKRAEILEVVSPELRRALESQWAAQHARIAVAEGKNPGPIGEGGRLFEKETVEEYSKAETQLGYGDYLRSKEIADFFSRTGFTLPDAESPVWDEALDYEDVKLKIIQQEGYDAHDFNLFDDRAAVLWRKPYVDGAVRELTTGSNRSPEQLRSAVEQLMLSAKNRNADIRAVVQSSHRSHANVRVDVDVDEREALLRDMRRNPEKYDDQ